MAEAAVVAEAAAAVLWRTGVDASAPATGTDGGLLVPSVSTASDEDATLPKTCDSPVTGGAVVPAMDALPRALKA